MTLDAASARQAPGLLLTTVGLLGFAAFAILEYADHRLYAWAIDLWSFHPASKPFFDLDAPLAWIRDWRAGLDVYRHAPPDAHGWMANYSPLLLRLPLPWSTPDSTPLYGPILDVLFLLTLALLPRPRTRTDAAAMLLALLSPLCVFALERGNLDLLMFALVALGVAGLEGGLPARVAAYGAILAAALLKLYPAVALLLLLRERRAVFLPIATVLAALLALFVLVYHDELRLMAANLPITSPFGDIFAALQLPTGFVFFEHALRGMGRVYDELDEVAFVGSVAVLDGVALICALRISRSPALRQALASLSGRESICLTVGAAIMTGCFFTGANVGYRAVHLLFVLPGMLALARLADQTRLARRMRALIAGSLLLMWSPPFLRLILHVAGRFWIVGVGMTIHPISGLIGGGGFWLLREAMWWTLMIFLLAVVIRTIETSPLWASAPSTR